MTGGSTDTDIKSSLLKFSFLDFLQKSMSKKYTPFTLIIVAVLFANSPAILHIVTTNPLVLNAALTLPTTHLLSGLPYIDPNTGLTLQSLGHLAAMNWIHGHIPWWNPFEGVGTPLAGEMQSGAFFPPTMLLLFDQGVLYLTILLESIAGISTFMLCRRLTMGITISTGAAIAFALSSSFVWITNAPMRPVAFLPVTILGVEMCLEAATLNRRNGWRFLAFGICLSILAGFPETTYIDSILVVVWIIARFIGSERSVWKSFLTKVSLGFFFGVLLASPLIVSFLSYLKQANVSKHVGTGFSFAALPAQGLPQILLPYSLGPIFGFSSASPDTYLPIIWGNVGGYLGVTLCVGSFIGIFGRSHRPLRICLGIWILLCLLRTFGFVPIEHLFALIPGMPVVAFFRYSNASWEFAAVILTGFTLTDVANHRVRQRWVSLAIVVALALSAWSAVWAFKIMNSPNTIPVTNHRGLYPVLSFTCASLALLLLLLGSVLTNSRRSTHSHRDRQSVGRMILASTIALEAMLLLSFTYLSAPRPIQVETSSVTWLQKHLGNYRFFSLGPISPDYGSYFNIAELNMNDVPVPKTFIEYVASSLNSNVSPCCFTGTSQSDPNGPSSTAELSKNLSNYEAVGVKFIIEPTNYAWPGSSLPSWPDGPRLVYRDSFSEIWELPHPSSFYASPTRSSSGATKGGKCVLSNQTIDSVIVDCQTDATIVRSQQYLEGWTATVNGTAVRVTQTSNENPSMFQQVNVPRGKSTVRFHYLPPFAVPAAICSLLALFTMLALSLRREGPKHFEHQKVNA